MIDFDREGLARILKVDEVVNHPNADRLEIARFGGWQCVVAKGSFKKNDICCYFEIDSILPEEVEKMIFGPDSKIKLKDSRVRTIKIRQAVSQGLAVPVAVIFDGECEEGTDVTKALGIGKKVPDIKHGNILNVIGHQTKKKHENPFFDKMRKPAHFKRVGGFDCDVVITEKIHGTSFVAGWVKRPTETLIQKLNAKLFGTHQFCYRSMNVQLQGDDSFWTNVKRFFKIAKAPKMEDTLYGRICIKYNLKNKLGYGHVVTGEIYGDGIQDNYTYGCEKGEQKLIGFGFRLNGDEVRPLCAHANLKASGIPVVPVLYTGQMPEDLTEFTEGPSVLCPDQKVREGCVINSIDGSLGWHGNALVKNINPEYLLDETNTEFN